jgi:hypothetical protein
LQAIQDMKEGKFDYHTPLPPALVQLPNPFAKIRAHLGLSHLHLQLL